VGSGVRVKKTRALPPGSCLDCSVYILIVV